jgi:hypothetical protein
LRGLIGRPELNGAIVEIERMPQQPHPERYKVRMLSAEGKAGGWRLNGPPKSRDRLDFEALETRAYTCARCGSRTSVSVADIGQETYRCACCGCTASDHALAAASRATTMSLLGMREVNLAQCELTWTAEANVVASDAILMVCSRFSPVLPFLSVLFPH